MTTPTQPPATGVPRLDVTGAYEKKRSVGEVPVEVALMPLSVATVSDDGSFVGYSDPTNHWGIEIVVTRGPNNQTRTTVRPECFADIASMFIAGCPDDGLEQIESAMRERRAVGG